jgi:hypothetical protein
VMGGRFFVGLVRSRGLSFYNNGWHEIRILGWSFLTSDVVFCRGAPWSTLCGLVKPGRLLSVSSNC